jgi:hypothetical protein
MTDKQKKNNVPLLISVTFNPKKLDVTQWLESCTVEHYGTLLQYTKNTVTIKSADILFDRNSHGEEFFKIISNTNLKVVKEVC